MMVQNTSTAGKQLADQNQNSQPHLDRVEDTNRVVDLTTFETVRIAGRESCGVVATGAVAADDLARWERPKEARM